MYLKILCMHSIKKIVLRFFYPFCFTNPFVRNNFHIYIYIYIWYFNYNLFLFPDSIKEHWSKLTKTWNHPTDFSLVLLWYARYIHSVALCYYTQHRKLDFLCPNKTETLLHRPTILLDPLTEASSLLNIYIWLVNCMP